MATSNWLNSPVLGNLSLGDIGSSALDFYNTWQNRKGANDAYDEIVGGYDEGIDYLKETGGESKDILKQIYDTNMGSIEPYQQAGTTALGDYMNLMQNPERITSDPGYQFRYDVGSEAQRRDLESAGYADPMGSGARPLGMETWAQGFATQELDSALNRRIPPMELGSTANRQGIDAGAYYGRGLTDINKYMGLGVSDMYGGKADALATKEMIDTMAMSNYIKGAQGLLAGAANPSFLDLIGRALSGDTDSDGNSLWGMLADAFGFDPDDEGIMGQVYEGILGGDDNRPAGWGDNLDDVFDVIQGGSGTPGINPNAGTSGGVNDADLAPETRDYLSKAGWVLKAGKWTYDAATAGAAVEAGTTVGGAEAGTISASGAAGWGATAMAASPLLAFGAVVALDQFMGGGWEPGIYDQLEDMKKSANPLQNIMEMSDMSGLLGSRYMREDAGKNVRQVQRGAMFNAVMAGMTPEQAADFQNYGTSKDRKAIIDNMITWVQSSADYNSRVGLDPDNKWSGLANIFPEVSQEDWKYFSQYESAKANGTLNDYAGDYGTTEFWGKTYQRHGSVQEATDRVNSVILAWETTNLVNDALSYNVGGAPNQR